MTKTYYWMLFEIGDIKIEDVTHEHPFISITKRRNKNPEYKALLNWRKITKEEYDLFQDILFNITKPEYN